VIRRSRLEGKNAGRRGAHERVTQALDSLAALREVSRSRVEKAAEAVRLIRSLGPYRWAGLYDVDSTEIAVIAWDGAEPPAHPRFPLTAGLNGAAVAGRCRVVVQDVSADARYLTTIGGTRAELIEPVLDESGNVIGTIDVESDRVNAFSRRDEELLSACAARLSWLWSSC
jgi:GAF domain-containing protein